ncbi:MAG: hypothetical protein OEZ59_01915 [Deltaproteobacteria bacterium]|nr:hypothetical protein [Deltaproteobacteria bacterium]
MNKKMLSLSAQKLVMLFMLAILMVGSLFSTSALAATVFAPINGTMITVQDKEEEEQEGEGEGEEEEEEKKEE